MNTYKQQLNMVQYAQVVTVTWYSFNFGVKSALSKKEKGRLYYKSNKKRKEKRSLKNLVFLKKTEKIFATKKFRICNVSFN